MFLIQHITILLSAVPKLIVLNSLFQVFYYGTHETVIMLKKL